jgi:hypothetical protein
MKRLLALLLMTICLVFAGAQSIPTVKSAAMQTRCTGPFIDPVDGSCYRVCCGPGDSPCHRVPCID